jgi:hypothetical protein
MIGAFGTRLRRLGAQTRSPIPREGQGGAQLQFSLLCDTAPLPGTDPHIHIHVCFLAEFATSGGMEYERGRSAGEGGFRPGPLPAQGDSLGRLCRAASAQSGYLDGDLEP